MLRFEDLEELVDVRFELTRLEKKYAKIDRELSRTNERLRDALTDYSDAIKSAKKIVEDVMSSPETGKGVATAILEEQRLNILTHYQLLNDLNGVKFLLLKELNSMQIDIRETRDEFKQLWGEFFNEW